MTLGSAVWLKRISGLALAWAAPVAAIMPSVDAPELAKPGAFGIGYRTLHLVHPNQPDLETPQDRQTPNLRRDRQLTIDLWYPATLPNRAKAMVYRNSLWGEPPRDPVTFTHKGSAVANAKPIGSRHPLIILSHGYSNAPALMTWLTENLASKGYVVAGIRHADPNPYIAAPSVRAAPFYLRPSDISFVAGQLRPLLGTQIDPDNLALIGYSQGGYGVLTAGGASLDPNHPLMAQVAHGALKAIARGSAGAETIRVHGVKAIIALAPAGGGWPHIWGNGLADVKAPLLLIAGEADPVVGYEKAARAFFEEARHSDRYLLTFRQAGHAIALNAAPAAMRQSLWDLDWFEDPIWRQDRVSAINLHFITAFLARHLRNAHTMQSYLDVATETSDLGTWEAPPGTAWGAYSPGGPGVTLWKGFQRRHAQGLRLEHRAAQD